VDRRMDLAFLRRLSADLGTGTLLVVGPLADPDPALQQIPRVRLTGSLPLEALPRLAREAAGLGMPYAGPAGTPAIQPRKRTAYLATGRPVVARDRPATRAWADAADLAATPEDFSRLVRLRVQSGLPAEQAAARLRLKDETWSHKARLFGEWGLNPT